MQEQLEEGCCKPMHQRSTPIRKRASPLILDQLECEMNISDVRFLMNASQYSRRGDTTTISALSCARRTQVVDTSNILALEDRLTATGLSQSSS